MPLLHKKPFSPKRLPRDLRPDEEVFVCKATQEVFRDYEKFFNRHFLCNSYVWTCSLTGQSSLTYTQALESEKDAHKLMDSFPECYQRAMLGLVHHAHRTNIRSLTDELLMFFKERYVPGERLELVQTTSSGAKVLRPVRVAKVIPPDPKAPSSPVRVSVITLPPSAPRGSPTADGTASVPASLPHNGEPAPHNSDNPPQPLTNGLSVSPPTSGTGGSSPNCFKTPKALTPRIPLTPQAVLNPSGYKYVVETMDGSEARMTVGSKQLSRQKGQLNPKKVKLFLRNALQRPSEKHPFRVKEDYVQKFCLGLSSVSSEPLPSPSPTSRSRKRSLSQASLDSFLSPDGGVKRSRPASLDTTSSVSKPKRTKKAVSKSSRRKSGSKTPKSSRTHSSSASAPNTKHKHRTPKSPKTPRSPNADTPKSPKPPCSPATKTPRSKTEALKVLNKAKKFRQMDLKKSVVKQVVLSPEEMAELQRQAEEERRRWLEVREAEKMRRQEERLERLRKAQQQRRLERLRQREMLRPREDTLCADSKPLPQPAPVSSLLPPELFGEAVMVLEFLHSFGPLFNVREVIREALTFEKVERCLVSSDTDTVLFDVVRFLMQAVFAAMEEEREDAVNLKDAISHREERERGVEGGEGEGGAGLEEGGEAEEVMAVGKGLEEDMEVERDEAEEEEKPLDIQVESVRASAVSFALWSHQTQRLPLRQLVVDPYTCSEVLRLHLLASGGYSETPDRRLFRCHRRGGYSDGDNPAIALRLRRPDLLDMLSRVSMYDLSPRDKLEVLSTLCTQLLTFSVAREHVEESCVRVKRARRRIREIQHGEERRRREALQQRAKERKEKGKKVASGSGTAEAESSSGDSGTKISAAAAAEGDSAAAEGDSAAAVGDSAPEKPLAVPEGAGRAGDGDEGRGEDMEAALLETEQERKERVEEELAELHEELADASNSVNLQPLGVDRSHQRYWLFPNLPGLFVEDVGLSQELSSAQDPPSLPSPPPLIHLPPASLMQASVNPDSSAPSDNPTLPPPPPAPSDNPTLPPLPQLIRVVEGGPQSMEVDLPQPPDTACQPVYQQQQQPPLPLEQDSRPAVKWACYSNAEETEALLTVLNTRGVRENALRKALGLYKSILLRTIDKCLFTAAGESKHRSPRAQAQALHYDSGSQYLELYLREQILDTEEKIHLGNLGHLRGAQSRDEWREAIENSGAAALVSSWREGPRGGGAENAEESKADASREADRSASPTSGSPTPSVIPTVRTLSQALLDMEAGIEPKFLMPPLGSAVDVKKKYKVRNAKKPTTAVKEADVCREQWRASLSQACSFSQIFLHLATLERAIMWSRSLMNVRCRICRRKGGDEYMLLCDGCDHGYHTYCLRPPLQCVPEGDWYCHDCSPVTPVKPRKRAQRVIFQEVESSESESDGEGQGEEEEEEEQGEGDSEEEEEVEEDYEEEEFMTSRSLRSQKRRKAPRPKRSGRLYRKPLKKGKAQGLKVRKTLKQKAKKPTLRAPQAPPVRVKKKLNLAPPRPPPVSKVESIVSAIIELRCSQGSRGGIGGAVKREQRGLEMQLCEALWDEVSNHDDSWPFVEPVKKKEYPDYRDVVEEPIDLKTIRSKIKRGDYGSLDGLVADMELMFANCQLFHRRHSEIGKAGVVLKKFFEKRCSDLGLKDLALMSGAPSRARLRSSARRKK